MSGYTKFITVCLAGSVGLNIYLLWPDKEPELIRAVTTGHSPAQTDYEEGQAGPLPDLEPALSHVPDNSADVSQARQWLQNGEFTRVQSFLITALRAAPDSSELLLLEADYILATQPLSSAVLHFYSLLELSVFTRSQKESIAKRIQDLVGNTIKTLYNAGDWDVLAQFLEPLFQLNSADEPLTLKLAEAYAKQQKFTLMEDVLANLPFDNSGANSLRERYLATQNASPDVPEQEPLQSDQTTMTRLALTRYGDQYIANTKILNRPAALLLDTGASRTAISHEFYLNLKRFNTVEVIGLFDVQTAGGRIRSPLVRIDKMTLGPYQIRSIGMFVMPEEAIRQADGLLGMNVLKQFHFQLDQTSAELVLSPRY